MSRHTQDSAEKLKLLPVRDFHSLRCDFPDTSSSFLIPLSQSYYPDNAVTLSVWAPALSLAATQAIDVSFFSSSYLDVSVQRVGLPFGMTGLLPAGLSHSEIFGSILVCKSPKLIAAYHVFLRLQEPRHPPYALSYFFCPHTPPIVSVWAVSHPLIMSMNAANFRLP